MTQSIASHVTQCLNLFRDGIPPSGALSKHPLEDQLSQKVRDEYTRFKVWSGNIGAHRDGMSSLDYRLRDSSHIRDHVVCLLQDLESLLQDATAIIKGEKVPWDQLSEDEDSGGSDNDDGYDAPGLEKESPDTELSQLTLDVADVINCLLRMSITIRSPSRHDRFVGSKSTETSHFEPFDIHHVQSKFPTIDSELAERLGRTITRRRQYFKYREAHHKKLSYGLEDDGNLDLAPETIASSIPDHLKSGRDELEPVVMNLADGSSESGFSQTSYALTTADPEQRLVPPLPEEATKGPFQCPFCFMMVIITNRSLWKRHVYGDLRPYICLVKNCKTPEKDFTRRHEWIQHMQDNHWKVYKCPSACDMPFASSFECKDHVIRNHPDMAALAQIDDLIELCAHPVDPSLAFSCPLCLETLRTVRQYQRHVGRHQEQLALFALPNIDFNEEQDAEANEEQNTDDRNDADGSHQHTESNTESTISQGRISPRRSDLTADEETIQLPEEPTGPSGEPTTYLQVPITNNQDTSTGTSIKRRIAIACKYCRRRKIRCNVPADSPGGKCTNCTKMNQECVFREAPITSRAASIPFRPLGNSSGMPPGFVEETALSRAEAYMAGYTPPNPRRNIAAPEEAVVEALQEPRTAEALRRFDRPRPPNPRPKVPKPPPSPRR